MSEMRALTVQEPWASAIIFGGGSGKDVENRTWATAYRGPLWIHVAKQVDWAAPVLAWTAAGLVPPPHEGWFDRSAWTASLPLGKVIGSVILTGCHHESTEEPRNSCSPWGQPDLYHWTITNPHPLADPVPCKGSLGLWRLPPEVEEAVRAQLEGSRG